ncbi:transmembrane protein 54 isoform X4 [Sciurus carolinensis]|uniref:transmembrane protein 54 isoform X4 n=1 Tax=Sciurus carolinensis TaxID=30640 RepID=UPI001FB4F9B8|nr:transmembrane protein 54 isoform X4 [Sciurus carolinensis]
MCLRLGGLSVGDFRKVLMKTGLVLVVLGHVSFIIAAVLHGTVLRYVAAPRDAVALQYCVVNILSVTSAIVGDTSQHGVRADLSLPHPQVIASGIAAIVLSRYLPSSPLGQALLATCTFGSPELLALAPDCPFDPTRIYSSSLCLWGISLVLCVAETVFAVRCTQLAHQLLELRPWWGKSIHHMSLEPMEGHDLLSCTSSVPLTL